MVAMHSPLLPVAIGAAGTSAIAAGAICYGRQVLENFCFNCDAPRA